LWPKFTGVLGLIIFIADSVAAKLYAVAVENLVYSFLSLLVEFKQKACLTRGYRTIIESDYYFVRKRVWSKAATDQFQFTQVSNGFAMVRQLFSSFRRYLDIPPAVVNVAEGG
jgi:hypothetical protein